MKILSGVVKLGKLLATTSLRAFGSVLIWVLAIFAPVLLLHRVPDGTVIEGRLNTLAPIRFVAKTGGVRLPAARNRYK